MSQGVPVRALRGPRGLPELPQPRAAARLDTVFLDGELSPKELAGNVLAHAGGPK